MDGTHVIARRDALRQLRTPHEQLWNEVAELSMPRHITGSSEGSFPPMIDSAQLHDSTLRIAALQLANGFCSLVTPREEVWHNLTPPKGLEDNDAAIKFYRECSEEITYRLDQSNFYTSIQETYLDRAAMGTACDFSEWDDEYDNLNFRNLPVGTYFIGQDHRNRVDCVIYEVSYTANQAAQEFGIEALPEKLQKEVKDPKKVDLHEFLISVEKTKPWDEKQDFPYYMCCVHEESKTVVWKQGYYEMPAHVTRYLRWGTSPYGFAPTWIALPEAHKLSLLQKQMDVLAEKAANPPILAPASLEGEIGVGALDITYVNDIDPNRSPREWATSGRYDIGQDRIAEKKKTIQEIMHGDLFRLFAQIERTMTATEATLREAEKVMQFSPTFSALTSEYLDPKLKRIFGILWRQGKMPEPPEELVMMLGENATSVPVPNVAYSNRISLAIKAKQNVNLAEYMAIQQPLVEQDPSLLDNMDVDNQFRAGWRNAGLPENGLRKKAEVEETRMARQQQMQMEQQMMQAQQAAAVAKDAAAANGGQLPEELMQGMGG